MGSADRTPLLRSLRFKILLVALGVLTAPLLFAFAWSAVERSVESSLRANVREGADEAVEALIGPRDDDPDSHRKGTDAGQASPADKLQPIAAQRSLRIRLFTEDGTQLVDANHEQENDPVHRLAVLVFGEDGAPSLQQFDDSLGQVVHRPEVLEAEGGSIVVGCRTSIGSRLLLCHAAHRVRLGERSTGIVYAQQSSRRAVRALYDARSQLFRLIVMMFPIALGLAWWAGSRIVRPIEALRSEALAKAASSQPEGKLAPRGHDEVGDLSQAFNTLLGKLDDRRGANERFVADLVHEFKNPVSTIRACADTLAQGHVDDSRATRLAKALAESSGRLDSLVSQLLDLARAEAGMSGEPRSDVDLAELARGVAESAKVRYPQVEFRVEGEEEAKVSGVGGRLESLLRNLVDNGAYFAAEHGGARTGPAEVRICIQAQEGTVVVEVTDNGPGIASEDLPRIFKRFFTTRQHKQGSGLGLALARAIAEAHQGTLEASSGAGGGATFTLNLPLSGGVRAP